MNSLVVFRHNCLPLLGCGFNCIFRHSQRLLLLQGLHIGLFVVVFLLLFWLYGYSHTNSFECV